VSPQNADIEEPASTGARLIRAEDVASQIGMTAEWVYGQTRKGLIPHVRLGRFYRYRPASIEAWLQEIERGAKGSFA
jgi:predicted DNA-binding transcriptional regulator AlpA